MPPSRLIVHSPDVPSSSAPESTMPITFEPWLYAAERKSASMDGRKRFSLGPFFTAIAHSPPADDGRAAPRRCVRLRFSRRPRHAVREACARNSGSPAASLASTARREVRQTPRGQVLGQSVDDLAQALDAAGGGAEHDDALGNRHRILL